MADDEDEFTAYLLDALRPWGAVTTRRIFGATGLWRGGVHFGFVTEDGLWLKGGEANRAALEEAGAEQFVYDAGKREVAMSYWSCPAEALDDPEALRRWVDGAWRAAASAAKTKQAPKAKRKP